MITTVTAPLADFLLARTAEDEVLAREAAGGFPDWVDSNEETPDGENVYFTVTATRGPGKAGAEWEPDYFLSIHEDRRDDARVGHIARHDPARVLAECEATRRLLEEHSREWHIPHLPLSPMNRYISKGRTAGLYRAMQYAALPHAGHPDYRQEWVP